MPKRLGLERPYAGSRSIVNAREVASGFRNVGSVGSTTNSAVQPPIVPAQPVQPELPGQPGPQMSLSIGGGMTPLESIKLWGKALHDITGGATFKSFHDANPVSVIQGAINRGMVEPIQSVVEFFSSMPTGKELPATTPGMII